MSVKKDIYTAFTPPKPQKRDEFLGKIPYPKLSFTEFVLAQAAYIRKRMWTVSALILLVGIYAVCFMPRGIYEYNRLAGVWIISSILPFLAMLTAAEISRSDIYGMTEIESGCRFGLTQIVTARLLILGICDFIVVSAVILVSGLFSPLGIVKSAVYILAPFLAVSGISLAVLRRFRGSEGAFLSAAAALGVSVAECILTSFAVYGTDEKWTVFCTAVCIVGIILMFANIKKIYNGEKNYGIGY